ncbi:MAG: Holliday junction resolvase RuvX [Clostridia bacterium]|nr:Holliday junction resolvase RuvX [Clostridia bacterium]
MESNAKRILALDVGAKVIGVAVSDPLMCTAQGIGSIRRGPSTAHDIDKIITLARQYEIGEVVVGLPLNMNGTLGPQGQRVKAFGRQLEEKLGIAVHYWDERLTTVAATRTLLEGDVSRQKRKKLVDRLAATYILQSYLDYRRNL